MPEPVPEPALGTIEPRDLRQPFDRLRGGTPPMLGYRATDVYAAAAEWLTQMADQMDTEGDDDAAEYWSPNLLYAPLYATVAAATRGMAEPAVAAVVVMTTAWFVIGDVMCFADPHSSGRTPLPGGSLPPCSLTDPATPRAEVVRILRESAGELKFFHDVAPADTPEVPR